MQISTINRYCLRRWQGLSILRQQENDQTSVQYLLGVLNGLAFKGWLNTEHTQRLVQCYSGNAQLAKTLINVKEASGESIESLLNALQDAIGDNKAFNARLRGILDVMKDFDLLSGHQADTIKQTYLRA